MQSEQTRQWKRQRKRLKREERRRSFRASAGSRVTLSVLPSMSDTLMEYAQPLIDLLPDDHGPGELKAMLQIASFFWNAVGEEEDLEDDVPILARNLVETLQMPTGQAFHISEALAERKVHRFGDDPRTVASVDVVLEGDKLRVAARSTV